jgi:hypothetical protein
MAVRQTKSVPCWHRPKTLGFVPAHWRQALLHNPTASLVKAAVLNRRRTTWQARVVINVPYVLRQ